MFYSICYDIRDDHRRLQVMKALKDYGERVQFSVFEVNLKAGELDRLRERVKRLLDPVEDALRVYPLCSACVSRIEILGEGKVTKDTDFIVI